MQGFGSVWHLVGRFFGSLAPVGPSPEREQWALAQLSPGERELFHRMSGPDRRHAIQVAADATRLVGPPPPPGLAAAALLHDVGKVEARLGTFGRVLATVLALALGRRRVLAWEATSGSRRRRLGTYLAHDRIGAELLERAGSADLVVTWAREHHLPEERWSLPPAIARCLKDADGD